ncbi:MAG: hypothetical protein PVH18_09475, partial [Chloroflexota bacterium]
MRLQASSGLAKSGRLAVDHGVWRDNGAFSSSGVIGGLKSNMESNSETASNFQQLPGNERR